LEISEEETMNAGMIHALKQLASRRVLAIAIGAIALGGTAFAISHQHERRAARDNKPAATASVTVDIVKPVATTFDRTIAATGTVAARDELVIGSDASGLRLTEVRVDVGSVVRRGQLLARADDAQLVAQIAQQHAQIKQAEVELKQAQLNLERAERLKESGFYSVEMFQTRRTSAESAAAKLDLVKAQLTELQVKLAHTRFVAPADGVIAKRSATVGAVVQPGAEMFRIIKDGEIEWLAELPSHSIARVESGALARIRFDDGRVIEARVRMIAPTMDAASRNGLVHVALPVGSPLKAGAFAKGEILIANAPALAMPESSVLTRDGYAFVYVVGADDVARMTRIETGARQRGLVEVTAGLKPDARIVGTGAGFVKDGDLVRVEPATSPRLARNGESS
jgi:RND family efflux transporter MFP subunit